MIRILIIEDNADLAFGLRNNLELEGYQVDVAADGEAGLAVFRAARPDLVVLDLMIPVIDGFRVLREMRALEAATPVLLLTARAEEADKVQGFRLGADDYVTKPFGVLELLARIEALLRRSQPDPAQKYRFGDIEVDPRRRQVTRAGAPVTLTPMELDLLLALLRRNGAVVSRLQLLREVWGHSDSVLTRTVDTHVAELRRKIERNPATPEYVLTARKAGYRIETGPRSDGSGRAE